jgi:hypothetical protein
MLRSSWDHRQEVYIINMIKLIEIAIWIHIMVQRVYIVKVIKAVENCALCCEKLQYRKNIRVYKNLYLKY